jgi:FlaG protein
MEGPRRIDVMEYGPAPISGVGKPTQRTASPPRPSLRAVADTPPPAVQQEFDVAARVIEELSSRQVNLHFEVDHDAGRVRVQVLSGDGAVVREIPARSLLDTLSGGGLIVDQLG